MIRLRNTLTGKNEGSFRSYIAIGKYLAEQGETGVYYAIPSNIKSIAGMKRIDVTKRWEDDEDGARYEREIIMEGSYY